MELLIKIGGLYNICLIIFHLLFWRIFNWKHDLRSLTFLNRATMQVLNISLTVIFVFFSYISFIHTTDLVKTNLGNSVLVFMAVFWILRSIQQIVFYKLKHWVSYAFLLFFLVGAVLYGVPASYKT